MVPLLIKDITWLAQKGDSFNDAVSYCLTFLKRVHRRDMAWEYIEYEQFTTKRKENINREKQENEEYYTDRINFNIYWAMLL